MFRPQSGPVDGGTFLRGPAHGTGTRGNVANGHAVGRGTAPCPRRGDRYLTTYRKMPNACPSRRMCNVWDYHADGISRLHAIGTRVPQLGAGAGSSQWTNNRSWQVRNLRLLCRTTSPAGIAIIRRHEIDGRFRGATLDPGRNNGISLRRCASPAQISYSLPPLLCHGPRVDRDILPSIMVAKLTWVVTFIGAAIRRPDASAIAARGAVI
jgi:hypothetical protein